MITRRGRARATTCPSPACHPSSHHRSRTVPTPGPAPSPGMRHDPCAIRG